MTHARGNEDFILKRFHKGIDEGKNYGNKKEKLKTNESIEINMVTGFNYYGILYKKVISSIMLNATLF